MRKGSLSLGSVKGIQLFVHWSFLLLLIYAAFSVWQAGGSLRDIASYIIVLLSVFVCVLLHELGHALTAKRYGIDTTDITLLPIGGLARLTRIPEEPRQELWVALAGPAVNVVIAIVMFSLAYFFGVFGREVIYSDKTGMSDSYVLNLAIVNITLVIFNLIPAYPMDGGRVLRALLAMMMNRVKATKIAAAIGQVLALGLAAFAIYNKQPFLVLIAIFVIFGARMEARSVVAAAGMSGYRVFNAMRSRFPVLQVTDSVTKGVQELLAGGEKDFVVMDGENFAGIVTRDALVQAVADDLAESPVDAITNRQVVWISPNEELQEAQDLLLRNSAQGFLPVIDNGKLLGIVDAENIAELLLIREAAAK